MLASRAHDREILGQRRPADLHLHRLEAGGCGLGRGIGRFAGRDHAETVVGGDGAGTAAQHLGERNAGADGEGVPGGHVDARHRDPLKSPCAEQGHARAHLVVQLDRSERIALDDLAQRHDELAQRSQRERVVAEEVGASDDALLGGEVDEEQRRLGHVPRRGADRRFQRRDDGAGLHVTDSHRVLPRTPAASRRRRSDGR